MKLLFDLFPVILFFIVFKVAGVFAATATAIAATFVQVGWVKYRHGKVDTMLWVSLGIITVFGGATLLLHDETFIKWKPTILYWFFAAALLVSAIVLKKNLMRALLQEKMPLPDFVWNRLNLSWSAFFVLLGILNLYVAYHFSTDAWVNFKLFGTTGIMLVFILAQSALLSKYVEEEKKES
ncbi:MAG: septation protein A [Gallionellaceae bacterium CG_4_9_14_0_8_um_filter_60_335]|nr:MAG: septation protein A [Gallionellaceae bacterium CG11_big_fil_rev_8_21_14_0_20_60_62]PIV47481.1 MAG: septation protein A [Gallionellaceae bacterium CG02_land_8_20_14_3_00_60_115]PJC04794.1 MAG: septation protein A [Gallionellaceae bacterium CG_4_9_14_0_8_um_filter_60_335]